MASTSAAGQEGLSHFSAQLAAISARSSLLGREDVQILFEAATALVERCGQRNITPLQAKELIEEGKTAVKCLDHSIVKNSLKAVILFPKPSKGTCIAPDEDGEGYCTGKRKTRSKSVCPAHGNGPFLARYTEVCYCSYHDQIELASDFVKGKQCWRSKWEAVRKGTIDDLKKLRKGLSTIARKRETQQAASEHKQVQCKVVPAEGGAANVPRPAEEVAVPQEALAPGEKVGGEAEEVEDDHAECGRHDAGSEEVQRMEAVEAVEDTRPKDLLADCQILLNKIDEVVAVGVGSHVEASTKWTAEVDAALSAFEVLSTEAEMLRKDVSNSERGHPDTNELKQLGDRFTTLSSQMSSAAARRCQLLNGMDGQEEEAVSVTCLAGLDKELDDLRERGRQLCVTYPEDDRLSSVSQLLCNISSSLVEHRKTMEQKLSIWQERRGGLIQRLEDASTDVSELNKTRLAIGMVFRELAGPVRTFLVPKPPTTNAVPIIKFHGEFARHLHLVNERSEEEEFIFDRVFLFGTHQSEVYAELAPMVCQLVDGWKGVILCYGVTGTGKTRTACGETGSPDVGLIPRICSGLFKEKERIEAQGGRLTVKLRVAEFGTHRRDLLKLDNREKGPVEVEVHSVEETLRIFNDTNAKRKVGETPQNEFSSRASYFFTFLVEKAIADRHGNERVTEGILHVGDLAGAEKFNGPDSKVINSTSSELRTALDKRRKREVYRATQPAMKYIEEELKSHVVLLLHVSTDTASFKATRRDLEFGKLPA